jgi:hypothetical protein
MICHSATELTGKLDLQESKKLKMEEKTQITQPVEVRLEKKGPIKVKGVFRFRDSSGNVKEGEQELYLCRCGGSASKPFCDGTHKRIGVPD